VALGLRQPATEPIARQPQRHGLGQAEAFELVGFSAVNKDAFTRADADFTPQLAESDFAKAQLHQDEHGGAHAGDLRTRAAH